MGDPKHLGYLLKAVRSIEGVFDTYRLTSKALPTHRPTTRTNTLNNNSRTHTTWVQRSAMT